MFRQFLCGNVRENPIVQVVFESFCLGKNYLTLLENLNHSADVAGLCAHSSAMRTCIRQVADKKLGGVVNPLFEESIVDGKFDKKYPRDNKKRTPSAHGIAQNGARHERGRTPSDRHHTRCHGSSEDHL